MKKYSIHWKVIKTSATGHGEPVFDSREMAESAARELNKEHRDIMHHWVEEVEVAD